MLKSISARRKCTYWFGYYLANVFSLLRVLPIMELIQGPERVALDALIALGSD